MKQKIALPGHKLRTDVLSFEKRTRNTSRPSRSIHSAPARRETTTVPSDISGVRSSTFQALHRNIRTAESISTDPAGSPHDWNRPTAAGSLSTAQGQDDYGETMFLTGGFGMDGMQTNDLQNIIAAARNHENQDSWNRRFTASFPCQKRCLLAFGLLLLGLLVPMAVVKVFDVNETTQSSHAAGRLPSVAIAKLITSLHAATKHSEAKALWASHVVVDNSNQLLIPETFESRLNAEVAPLLEQHVDILWDDANTERLRCQEGEHELVAFSVVKSASLPAAISYERPCVPHPHSTRCVQKKRVADVRDLVVTLPAKSSKHTYSVKVAEDRAGSSDRSNVPTPRRVKPFGTISGPFQVELSDGSKLAIQRYCGTNSKNFAEDLDIELVTKDNTRLLTIYELKRLYSLWSKARRGRAGERRETWDSLQLSRATIDPIDHSRHSLTVHDLALLFSASAGVDSGGRPSALAENGVNVHNSNDLVLRGDPRRERGALRRGKTPRNAGTEHAVSTGASENEEPNGPAAARPATDVQPTVADVAGYAPNPITTRTAPQSNVDPSTPSNTPTTTTQEYHEQETDAHNSDEQTEEEEDTSNESDVIDESDSPPTLARTLPRPRAPQQTQLPPSHLPPPTRITHRARPTGPAATPPRAARGATAPGIASRLRDVQAGHAVPASAAVMPDEAAADTSGARRVSTMSPSQRENAPAHAVPDPPYEQAPVYATAVRNAEAEMRDHVVERAATGRLPVPRQRLGGEGMAAGIDGLFPGA